MQIVDREGPLYTYRLENGREIWTVMQGPLAGVAAAGCRCVSPKSTRAMCSRRWRAQGLALPAPQKAAGAISGTAIVTHQRPPLTAILRDMLRYSTNLTAEVVGLSATRAGGVEATDLAASGAQMADWARARLGVGDVRFADHSGLGDRSRIAAQDMVQALAQPLAQGPLRAILRPFSLRDEVGRARKQTLVKVNAKTGTLNFVSGLAGYVTMPSGADLVFAIFVADLNRRDMLTLQDRERPPGGRAWVGRARTLESRLIERWAAVYGT
jgi:D-alanyl-D-alanine carboxypeptidase/D-alanyl-D-alanine-endopeptidase (penicillin-binding protein 4)